MSKRCCGVIYSDDEDVCKICGKSLEDAEVVDFDLDNKAKTDEEAVASDKEKKEDRTLTKATKEAEASAGLKAVGIISLIFSVLGAGFVVLCIFVFIVSPIYKRGELSENELAFPELVNESAEGNYYIRPELSTATDATVTDATSSDADISSEADKE